jgi:hypothetical protein
MGHWSAKDSYQRLSEKLDGFVTRMPDHDALRALLRELYAADEAELVARMPWGLSRLDRVARVTRAPEKQLLERLHSLADRGLVIDSCRD